MFVGTKLKNIHMEHSYDKQQSETGTVGKITYYTNKKEGNSPGTETLTCNVNYDWQDNFTLTLQFIGIRLCSDSNISIAGNIKLEGTPDCSHKDYTYANSGRSDTLVVKANFRVRGNGQQSLKMHYAGKLHHLM